MRALIINLTRLGDLLQTQPVIHGLKAEGHTVGLICLENFTEASRRLSDLDYINPLPGDPLLLNAKEPWHSNLQSLYTWIAYANATFPAEIILNLTPTLPARILARCLGTANNVHTSGFGIDSYGFGVSDTMWAKFFEATSYRRDCSPYNVVDIFRKIARVDRLKPKYQLKKPSKTTLDLASLSEDNKRYIGFQLGASAAYRQWPVKSFAHIGKKLYENFGITPILLGHVSEKNLADEYRRLGAPCVDLIGKTSLTDLAAALSLCELLITNDTGTMHLAAGLGVRSLAIFLATAQAYDTAPYLEDCCCVEPALSCHPCEFDSTCPNNLICQAKISPEQIWPLIEFRLNHEAWPNPVPLNVASEMRVWLTKEDETNFLNLVSLSGHDKEDRSLWLCIQRSYYRQLLDNIDSTATDHLYSPAPQKTSLLSLSFKKQAQETLTYILDLLNLLIAQGHSLMAQPQDRTKKKFIANVENIDFMLTNSPQFNALGRLWSVSIQERGRDLQEVLNFCLSFQTLIASWLKDLSK